MDAERPNAISIILSPAQVEQVVRAAARGSTPAAATLLAGSFGRPQPRPPSGGAGTSATAPSPRAGGAPAPGTLPRWPQESDPRMSRSLLRGLTLLGCFVPGGGSRGVVEVARDLGLSPSTAHRYVLTLVELGLLDRCPHTRKYRLAAPAPGPREDSPRAYSGR